MLAGHLKILHPLERKLRVPRLSSLTIHEAEWRPGEGNAQPNREI